MLRPKEGIHSIKVALLAERGVVEYDPALWDPDRIIDVCTLVIILYGCVLRVFVEIPGNQ